MNVFKRILSMLLVLCMLISVVPMTTFATDTDTPEPQAAETEQETTVATEETTVATEVTTAPTGETEAAAEETEAATEETEAATEETEAATEETEAATEETEAAANAFEAITGFALNRDADIAVAAIEMGTKPDNGTTTGNPFKKGTADSNSFRIPAMVTLSDGTIVAAADARWNSTLDNGGIDTLVSVSDDQGKTWHYSYANYLGDNGNAYDNTSSCFIDPALAVDWNDTIYMLVDLYPYGVAITGTAAHTSEIDKTGFDKQGRLLLSNDNHNTYGYYLDGEVIRSTSGAEQTGYTVDGLFNVYKNGQYHSNLFFADCDFKVQRTGYLYLTKGTYDAADKTIDWSDPQLLPLKGDYERACLVGPGRGLVTADERIVFPVYSYRDTGAEFTGLVHSEDGKNWHRTSALTGVDSSEAAIVELPSGDLRVFFRNHKSRLCYADYSFESGWANEGSWTMTNVPVNSNTQLSAITYSKTFGNEQVILVSCPAGPNPDQGSSNNAGGSDGFRKNGRIFAFAIDEDFDEENGDLPYQLELLGQLKVNDGGAEFMYSCLTENLDGSVAILFEDHQNGWGGGNNDYYYTMDYKTYTEDDLEAAFGIQFDELVYTSIMYDEPNDVAVNLGSIDNEGWTMTVTPDQTVAALTDSVYVAYDITINNGNGNYTNSAEVTLPLGDLAGKTGIYGFVVNADGTIEKEPNVTIEDGYITFTAPHFSVVGAAVDMEVRDVTVTVGGDAFTDTISGVAMDGSNAGAESSAIANVTWTDTTTEGGTTEQMVPATLPTTAGSSIQCYISDGNGNYLTLTGSGYSRSLTNTTDVANATLWTITYVDYKDYADAHRYTVKFSNYTINLSNGTLGVTTSNNNVNHYYKADAGFYGSSDGSSAWKCESGKWTVGGANTGNAKVYTKETVITEGTASTAVSITGVAPGNTQVDVGTTRYNITVNAAGITKNETVTVQIGKTAEYTDNTGNYENDASNRDPDNNFATMKVEGQSASTLEALTTLNIGDEFYIEVEKGVYLKSDATTTTNLEEAELWYAYTVASTYCVIRADQNSGNYLGFDSYNNLITSQWTNYTKLENGVLKDYYEPFTVIGTPVQATGGAATATTKITFTGVSVGNTVAVVGTTQYNIKVVPPTPDHEVNIELEIGESFTYTDTTGNYVNVITQTPVESKATMNVAGTTNSTSQKLVPVTEKNFTSNKKYVIENVRAADNTHVAYQPDHSVLTSTKNGDGLDMNGPLDVNTSPKWTFIPDDNFYQLKRNNEYVTFSYGKASMETYATKLTFEYVDSQGWLISYNGNYLSDMYGKNSGEAFGYNDSNDDGNYWNIYEVVEETTTNATKVTFTGVAEGKTTAIVGATKYNITVVPSKVDDEVHNSATDIWTVDPEVQRQRYNALIGLHKDLYTDDSWRVYETARQAAYKKLVEVTHAEYKSAAEAQAALNELTGLVDALETAHGNLLRAKTISVRYTYNGKTLDTREYKVASTDPSLTLPASIVVDNTAYRVTNTTLNLQGDTGAGDTAYEVEVTLIGKLGGGFVGTENINNGQKHNDHPQICTLVDKKITEMTLSTGVSYDLDLATDTTGYTVTWSTDNADVATVDDNGKVTSVNVGTTYITATVMNGNEIVEVNSIPVTVLPGTNAAQNRDVALYIEDIDNTTVWCSLAGYAYEEQRFEVIEGELIYGTFDKTASILASFFGDPDEAHALVYMKSTNSDDHYFLLHDEDGNLYDGTVTPNESYYVSGVTSGAGYWQAVAYANGDKINVNWNPVKDMVQWAINLGCDGGLGFSRQNDENDLCSNLQFASDPMPRIEKVIDGVLPTSRKQADYRRYTENMVAAVNELVYFKITVTQEVPSVWKENTKETIGAIVYDEAWVTDKVLPGAYLYTKQLDQDDGTWDGEIAEDFRTQEDKITEELNAAWTAEQKAAGKRTFPYYLVYEIQESDIPKFYIDNIANLSYNYGSKYSKGAQAGTADAEARISVVGTAIDDVVIDFGQSFTYKEHKYTSITDGETYTFTGLTNAHLKNVFVEGQNDFAGYTTSKAIAKYGEVKVYRDATGQLDDKGYPEYTYTVTYKPTQILQGVDSVQLYGMGENNQEKIINGFLVYPATTVYYEEGFMLDGNTGWNDGQAQGATMTQEFELLGASQFDDHGMLTHKVSNKKHAYGYDPIYANPTTEASYISSTKVGDATSFTFTGTGFDLYANCTENTGNVAVQIKNAAGATVKLFMVNTVVKKGTSNATAGQVGDMNSLPIVSWHTDNHGTYTVFLRKITNSDPVKIDGVRIFGTLDESKYSTSPYAIDREDNPNFFQLRDYVLSALEVKDDTSKDYGTVAEMAGQVYEQVTAGSDEEAPSSVILADGIYNSNVQDLLDNGPKNEIYLHTGETLVFKVNTSRAMQIGMKAPKGETSYTISGATTDGISGSLETSVDMFYELGNAIGTTETYTITITNNGDNLLSITDLKICDDPNAAFVALTAEDIEEALYAMGYEDVVKELPEQTKTVDYKHATIAISEEIASLMPADAGEMTFRLVDVAVAAAKGKAKTEVTKAAIDENGCITAQVKHGKDGETITFTVEVDSDMYETATIKLVIKLAKKGTEIRKQKLAEQKVHVQYKHNTKSISECVGSLMPADAGEITYRLEKVETAPGKGKDKIEVKHASIDAEGNLTAEIKKAKKDDTITFVIKAESDMYEPATIKVVVKLVK